MHWSDTSSKFNASFRSAFVLLSLASVMAATGIVTAPSARATGTYQVTIVGPSQSPSTGVPFVISGTVTPAAAGSRVRLQRFYGGRFHTVANGQLDADSSYTFAQVFDTVGGRTFRVTKKSEQGIGKGISPLRRIFVTGSTMHSSVILKAGNGLTSFRGSNSLTLLATGDVVMTLNATGRVIWSFGTAGHPGATAVLQRDGNFVVHDADGKVVKTSGSGGHPLGTYSLTLREDSDANISSPDGKLVWSSLTTNTMLRATESLRGGQFLRSFGHHYQLVMRRDGNLVVYNKTTGAQIWDTGTSQPNSRVVMGPGGAMTVYGPLDRELCRPTQPATPAPTRSCRTTGIS